MRYKYDVALSFSSEKEAEVEKIADYLEAAGLRVYFYKKLQGELISQDLDKKTYQIYHEQSEVKVLFISRFYGEHEYSQLEKRLCVDSTKNEKECLIIVNYLGKEIEKEFGKVIYIDGNDNKVDQIAMLIQQRVLHIREKKRKDKDEPETNHIMVNINNGIVAGDNASFQNLTFR